MTEPEQGLKGQWDERSSYAGRWIACLGGRIVGQGGTPQQALRAAKASRFKETPQITFVDTVPPFKIHPILEKIASLLAQDQEIYVVGGAVRDALLRRPVHELDFTLPERAIRTARKIADSLEGAFYALDKDRDYGRVILFQPEGNRLVLDFAAFQGESLEEDLKGRDFTINAMAVDVHHPQELLDPLGGGADLYSKHLCVCTPEAFIADPVRILRGIRFAISLGFTAQTETKERMRAAVDLLPEVSPERVRDELFQLLESDQPAAAIRTLDYLHAMPYVLPELPELKGVEQSLPHISDVWEHSLDVLKKLYYVLSILQPAYNPENYANLHSGVVSHRLGRYREQIDSHLKTHLTQDRSIRELLFLAALYHDIGKPQTRQLDQDGRFHFYGHEEIGSEIALERGSALQLSNPEIDRLRTIVLNHMRPIWLAQSGSLPSRRAIYRYFRDTGPAGVDICLLSLADTLATFGPTLPADTWAHQVEVIRILLEAYWENNDEIVSPPALINGNDLIGELGLKPSPLIGQLLADIQEAQAAGMVGNRRQALELASDLLNQSQSDLEKD